jgi:non-canonical poly(A) RNA polymerase PAPD5/7
MEDDFIFILSDLASNSESESSSPCVNNLNKKRPSSSSSLLQQTASKLPKKQDLISLTAFQFTKLNPSPWICHNFRYSKDPTKRLHQEILHFIQYATPSAQEHEARMETVKTIEQTILRAYPEAQVKVFGSYDTKLYLPSADIDLVLFGAFGGSYNATGATLLRKVSMLLVQAGIAIESSVKIISKARIPIIKFTDAAFHFDVDMSFNVESGLESAEIMKALVLVEIIPSIKPLTLVIKQFLSIRKLNEVFFGGLGSYSITLLIVSFLQMHPLVQAKLIKPEENYGVLLVEFFELYGKLFNYERVGIFLKNGGFYFDKVACGWCNSERFMLCLEDP